MSFRDALAANTKGEISSGENPSSGSGFLGALKTRAATIPAQSFSETVAGVNKSNPSSFFYKQFPDNFSFGASNEKDASGLPYLAYKLPGATASTTDYTRVATTFNPLLSQPVTADSFHTPRAVANRAALKSAMGGTYSDELDHAIALELAGSNNEANLIIQPGRTTAGVAATSDKLENQLAAKVTSGQMSLFQAQYELASSKGTPVPYMGDTINKYAENAYTTNKKAAEYAASPLGLAENTLGSIGNWALSLGSSVLDHIRASITSPEGVTAAAHGAVQTAILKPAAFLQGMTNSFLTNVEVPFLSKIGIQDTGFEKPVNLAQMVVNMNSSLPRTPDEQKAFETGSFLGWMAPYSKISGGVEAALDSARIAEYAPKLAPILPYVSDAIGFLGTGQILHSPSDGSRVQQLKNDTIALAIFDIGGFALKGAGAFVAKGLSNILPESAKVAADEAMVPIVDSLQNGEKVTADELDHAVTQANTAIEEGTGKTARELLQDHLGITAPVETTTKSAVTQEAESMVQKDLPDLVDQYLKEYGNEVNTDNARELFPSYQTDRSLSADVHEPASTVAKSVYDKLLNDREGTGNNTVLFTAGGTGAGKSSAVRALTNSEDFPIIYDTNNANLGSASDKIDEALSHGYNVEIHYVHNDIGTSLDNALTRAENMRSELGSGRTVPLDEHIDTHLNAPQTFSDLVDKYADNNRVKFLAINNEGNNPSIPENPIDFVKSKVYNDNNEELKQQLKQQLEQQIKDAHVAGKISDETATGFLGRGKIPETSGGNKLANGEGANATQPEVKLADFPDTGQTFFGVAFPGANYVGRFIQKDIIERFDNAREAIKGIIDASSSLFETDPIKEQASAIVGSTLMTIDKFKSAAWSVAEERRDWWAKMPKDVHLDFLDKMEQGIANANTFSEYGEGVAQTMADLANQYRGQLDKTFAFEKDMGVQANYIADYVPHYWTNPELASQYFQDLANSLGTGKFTKLRVIDLIQQGLDYGLELKTTNPEELVLMREIDGMRISAQIGMMHELEQAGLAIPTKGAGVPKTAGWPLVNGSDGIQYAVPPEVKQIFDRAFFKNSLWSNEGIAGKIFRTVMAIKGTFVPLKLALSAFHPIHIFFIDSSSERARIWEDLIKGDVPVDEAIGELTKASSFVSQISDVTEYWNIGKLWDTPMNELTDSQRTIIQYIIDGGGTPKMSEEFKIRASDGFKQALTDENYIGAAIRGVPQLIEAYQKPVFETYIPALKVASYVKGVEDLLENNPELATDDLARKVEFRKLWQSMDNRFGQMVYKTNFWNPMLKEVGQASFLSLGWQVGFFREFGGGALDLAKFLGKSVVGKATADDITQKMLFSIDYTVQAALVGGLMTYVMTGKLPQGVQDLFFPNTGKVNPDGSPARLNTSFYTREFFTLANHLRKQGIVGGSVSMVENKMSPILNSIAEIWNNKDFYGYEIHDPNANIAKQAEQLTAYLFENNVLPISVTGAQQAEQTTGILGEALSYAGFNPAPKYIAETPIQSSIYAVLDRRTGGSKPLESKPASDAKQNIRQLYQQGNIDGANKALDAAMQAGYISEQGKGTFIASLDLPADVRAFESLNQFPSDQEQLLSQMDEEELARYAGHAAGSVKSHISSLSTTAKKFVEDLHAGRIQLETFKAGKAIQSAQ